jgi:ribose 1,5-bisphosphokinase PhnN
MKNGITIIGSSGVGKTTLIRSLLKDERLKNIIDIPKRYITRDPRKGDNLLENKYVSTSELAQMIPKHAISVVWERVLDKTMQYAFAKPKTGLIPIYSANNAIYQYPKKVKPLGFFEDTIIVGITASYEDRLQRLKDRSPDLFEEKAEQIKLRLADSADNILPYVDYHFTNKKDLETSKKEFADLIYELIRSELS